MEHTDFDGIIFADTLQDFNALRHTKSHSYSLQRRQYGLYVSRHPLSHCGRRLCDSAQCNTWSDFSDSGDFQGIFMSLSDLFITSIAIRSNYGIIGHLSLLQNPVMKLSFHDFRVCKQAMLCIRERMEDKGHLFREELLGSLLTAHILDLYDIHARRQEAVRLSEHITFLLRKFIELLYNGEYIRHRSLDFYASRLCITPHYLSEICKEVSGRPATYWIDRFTLLEITRLLWQKELSLTEIAEKLNFSSVSYFSRYVQKKIGISPSEYRKMTFRV